jgi:hypothetical protein
LLSNVPTKAGPNYSD